MAQEVQLRAISQVVSRVKFENWTKKQLEQLLQQKIEILEKQNYHLEKNQEDLKSRVRSLETQTEISKAEKPYIDKTGFYWKKLFFRIVSLEDPQGDVAQW